MQLYLNGNPDAALAATIGARASTLEAPCSEAEAANILGLLDATDEEAFATAFMERLHHYTALPYQQLEHLANAPGPTTGPISKLYRRAVQHLLHGRILPLGRWLLWRQSSINRTLADGLRFELQRARAREAALTERVERVEAELKELRRASRGGQA